VSQIADDQMLIGQCFCGERFFASEADEYHSLVSRHILKNHQDQPPDEVLVRLMEGDINE